MTRYFLKPKPSKLISLAKKYFELGYSDKNILKEKARSFVKEKGCLNKKPFMKYADGKARGKRRDIKKIMKQILGK